MDFYGIKLKANIVTDAGVDIGDVTTPIDTLNADNVDADIVNGTTYNGTTINGTTVNASTVNATTLNGTSTFAKWGDLAEKYVCKEKCEIGTVIAVSADELVDVEPCAEDLCTSVIGVVSEKPAFCMNNDADGEMVGLTGMLKVKIVGPIEKSNFIVPTVNGCARAGKKDEIAYKIGVANENNPDPGVKLVNCVIK